MKKGTKIILALLAVIFFAQVCFANYAINPEVKKSITDYDEKQTGNHQLGSVEEQRRWLLKAVIIAALVIIAIVIYSTARALNEFERED